MAELVHSDARAARLSHLLEVEVALVAGDEPDAAKLLNAIPVSSSELRPELFLAAQVATQAGQGEQANAVAQRLQVWVATKPHDAQAWQLLSSLYAIRGQTLSAIRADAETQVARLDYAAALDRFRAAQELSRQGSVGNPAVDHIEASIIDTRRRQVELLLKEQSLDR
jgi:predicted Zn-dependent protease